MGPQWSLIGIFLGIPYSTIKRIDFEGDLDDKVEKMVSAWLKKKHDIAVFGEPTWRILVEAVAAKSGGNDRSLAERIASEHPLLPGTLVLVSFCNIQSSRPSIIRTRTFGHQINSSHSDN